MGTSVSLPEPLLRAAQERADRELRSLEDLVESAVRAYLEAAEPQGTEAVSLPTMEGDLVFGDLTDREAAWYSTDA